MTDRKLIETEIGSPPADRTPASQQGLPEDLLREAAHRLGIVCLVSAGLWAANFIMVHFVHPLPGTLSVVELSMHDRWVPVFDWVGGAAFVVSLALFWYTRRSRKSPRFLLDLALVYEVFIALNIAILNYAVGAPGGVSWIAIIILLFPPVIPSTPRKTLVAALLAASMDPIGALFEGSGSKRPCDEGRPDSRVPQLPLRHDRPPDLPHHHPAGSRGAEGAGDGELRARRSHRSRRDGRSVAGNSPVSREARSDQADQTRGAGCRDQGTGGGAGAAVPARGPGGGQPPLAAHHSTV